MLGYDGNDGTLDTDYFSSIKDREVLQGNGTTGAFHNGANQSSAAVDFDQGVAHMSSYFQGSQASTITAHDGDTFSSLAAQLWGDSAPSSLKAEPLDRIFNTRPAAKRTSSPSQRP